MLVGRLLPMPDMAWPGVSSKLAYISSRFVRLNPGMTLTIVHCRLSVEIGRFVTTVQNQSDWRGKTNTTYLRRGEPERNELPNNRRASMDFK